MAYIGKQPVVGNFVKLDAITTSATTTFNLLSGGVAYSPQSANHCIVSLNGVIQSPNTSFTISGSTIVFASALTSSDVIDFILVLGDVLNIGTPSDATVTFPKVTSNLITGATAETSIAGGDQILIYDDSATALRKMTRTNFVSGLGAAAGQVIQAVSATDQTNRSTTSNDYVTASNTLTATITPSATANKILVLVSAAISTTNYGSYTVYRGATNLAGTGAFTVYNPNDWGGVCMVYLDSPSTTSATTYQVYFKSRSSEGAVLNTTLDGNTSIGSIVCLEIKG
jgi:hypothetical protein